MSVAEFGIAVNRKWRGKDGEDNNEVCFVDCQAFSKIADNLNKFVHKGDPLLIEGRLKLDSWTAQDGTKRSKHRVVVDSFQFLSSGEAKQEAKPDDRHFDEPSPDDDSIPF